MGVQASSQSSGWPPLPGILLEPKAHVQCGDFDRMVLLQVQAISIFLPTAMRSFDTGRAMETCQHVEEQPPALEQSVLCLLYTCFSCPCFWCLRPPVLLVDIAFKVQGMHHTNSASVVLHTGLGSMHIEICSGTLQ